MFHLDQSSVPYQVIIQCPTSNSACVCLSWRIKLNASLLSFRAWSRKRCVLKISKNSVQDLWKKDWAENSQTRNLPDTFDISIHLTAIIITIIIIIASSIFWRRSWTFSRVQLSALASTTPETINQSVNHHSPVSPSFSQVALLTSKIIWYFLFLLGCLKTCSVYLFWTKMSYTYPS